MKRGCARSSASGRARVAALRRNRRHLDEVSTSAASRAGRLAEIARGEQMRRQQVLGEDDELRPDHRGKDAAGQNPGDDLRPVGFARGIGGGKAIGLVRGGIKPAAEGAGQQQPEHSLHHRGVRDQAGKNAKDGAALQREAAAVAARKPAHRQRAEPHAEHHGGDRQRREPLVGRQHGANDAGGGDDDGVVAAGQRLRHRQHHGVAARELIVDVARGDGFGQSRHAGVPRQTVLLLAACALNSYCRRAQGWIAPNARWLSAGYRCGRNARRRDGGPRRRAPRASERAPIWPSDERSSSI